MIRRTVHKHRMDANSEIKQNLQYWLGRPPEERLAAVDMLRRQIYGNTERLQRTARVIQLPQSKKQSKWRILKPEYRINDHDLSEDANLYLACGSTAGLGNKTTLGRKKDLADIEALGQE